MTAKIIGYGEDSLTYWALSTQLTELLRRFGDDTPAKDCTVFYRPSFGRGENVGEFDALISTSTCIYLIESKWHRSKEYKKSLGRIILDQSQVNRHTAIERLLLHTRGDTKLNTNTLLRGNRSLKQNTLLSRNIDHLWKTICSDCGDIKTVRHICLFFSPSGDRLPTPKVVSSNDRNTTFEWFSVIPIQFPPDDQLGGFINISRPS